MSMCTDCIHNNGEFGCELGPNQYPSCRRAMEEKEIAHCDELERRSMESYLRERESYDQED